MTQAVYFESKLSKLNLFAWFPDRKWLKEHHLEHILLKQMTAWYGFINDGEIWKWCFWSSDSPLKKYGISKIFQIHNFHACRIIWWRGKIYDVNLDNFDCPVNYSFRSFVYQRNLCCILSCINWEVLQCTCRLWFHSAVDVLLSDNTVLSILFWDL